MKLCETQNPEDKKINLPESRIRILLSAFKQRILSDTSFTVNTKLALKIKRPLGLRYLKSCLKSRDVDPDPDCESGSGYGSRDPIESASNPDPDTDPDPQH
jgi:hypothetical protein